MADRRDPVTAASSAPLSERGLEMRRRVLGREYVDAALSGVDDFGRPLQELVTEYCWGAIWTRPELDPATRSLITIAMLVGLNRPDELRLHVQGAIRNGCSPDQVREVILQSAIYLGVPAALPALGVARQALADTT